MKKIKVFLVIFILIFSTGCNLFETEEEKVARKLRETTESANKATQEYYDYVNDINEYNYYRSKVK